MTRLSGVTGMGIARKMSPNLSPTSQRAASRRDHAALRLSVPRRRRPRYDAPPSTPPRPCSESVPPAPPSRRCRRAAGGSRPRVVHAPARHAVMTSRRRCVAAPSGGPGVAASRRRWTSPPAAGRCRWRPVPRASCWEGVVACRRRRRCRGQPWRPLLAVCYLSYGTVQYLPYYKTKKYE